MKTYEKWATWLTFVFGGGFVSVNYEPLRDALGIPRALVFSGLALFGVYFCASRIVVNSVRSALRSRHRG